MCKNSCFSASDDSKPTLSDCDVTTSSTEEDCDVHGKGGRDYVDRCGEDLKMYEEFFQELTDNPVSFYFVFINCL